MSTVRRMVAILLLVCLGALVPAAALPFRVCLLENLATVTEIAADGTCCDDCERKNDHDSDCCFDLSAPPDSAIPESSVIAPPLVVTEIAPQVDALAPRAFDPIENRIAVRSAPDTGPPTARQSVLGVWRL